MISQILENADAIGRKNREFPVNEPEIYLVSG